MKKIYQRSSLLFDRPSPYCPGCGHGIIQRIICELLEEFSLEQKCIFLAPVGCAILAYDYIDVDVCQPAHGRTPAVATGIKRARPDSFVVSYQGDGDLAAIGTAEIIHAAARGENITTVFVNNAIYGMTGGQMAPTTIVDQKTATTPFGRNPKKGAGYPIKVCEMLSSFDGVTFLARTSLHNPANIIRTKKTLKNAFHHQLDKKGFSLVEILSPCPVNWKMDPVRALDFIKNSLSENFPLGVFKNKE